MSRPYENRQVSDNITSPFCKTCGELVGEFIYGADSYLFCSTCNWKAWYESSGDTRRIFQYEMIEADRAKSKFLYDKYPDYQEVS